MFLTHLYNQGGSLSFISDEENKVMVPRARALGKTKAAKSELAKQPIDPTLVVLSTVGDQSIAPPSQ